MRRTASEILHDLEMKVARLERQAHGDYEPDFDLDHLSKELDPAQALSDLKRKVGNVKVLHTIESKHYVEFYVWDRSSAKLFRVDGAGHVTTPSSWSAVR